MGWGWKPYVSAAERREKTMRKMVTLRKKGLNIEPIVIEGRKIASTFWGASWCQHLESFSDYDNRLPRGRTYVRNGSVCHLEITPGSIKAIVSGSTLYDVKITIRTLAADKWRSLKKRCSGQVSSLLDLLKGRLSDNVMSVVTDPENGLFPLPREIHLSCSCPDWADMCKHVAAVLYGVGARLDRNPELLFLLRGVDHEELICTEAANLTSLIGGNGRGAQRLETNELEDIFGIELAQQDFQIGHNSDLEPTLEERRAEDVMGIKLTQRGCQNNVVSGAKLAHEEYQTPHASGVELAYEKPLTLDVSKTELAHEEHLTADVLNQPRSRKGSEQKTKVTKSGATARDKNALDLTNQLRDVKAPSTFYRTITGKSVFAQRTKFEMTQREFAKLIGVSTISIINWEKNKRGKKMLNIMPRSVNALYAVSKLSKAAAWRLLERMN